MELPPEIRATRPIAPEELENLRHSADYFVSGDDFALAIYPITVSPDTVGHVVYIYGRKVADGPWFIVTRFGLDLLPDLYSIISSAEIARCVLAIMAQKESDNG